MRENQKHFWIIKTQIDEQISMYNDLLRYDRGGDDLKKTVTFQRTQLYEEIWEKSLSRVAEHYDVPYSKLKDACREANIPLPSQSYWGNLHSGKRVEKDPLPDSAQDAVTIVFTVREASAGRIKPKQPEDMGARVSSVDEPVAPPKRLSDGRNIYERETLYREVWAEPVSKVAEKYGVSDVMIHKICKSLNVPAPPRGYWAKKQAGKKIPRTPLPKSHGQTEVYGKRSRDEEEKDEPEKINEGLDFLPDDELAKVLRKCAEITVDTDKKRLHAVLTKHKAAYRAYARNHPRDPLKGWNRDSYRNVPPDEPLLYNSVSEETLPRVYRILDALYTAIEELGGKVNEDLSVQIRGEHVAFSISESQEQVPHVITKKEQVQIERYESEKKLYSYVTKPQIRKYDYIATGRLTIRINDQETYFRDSTERVLENRLDEILYDLYLESEAVRIKHEADEAARRKAEEEKHRRELQSERYDEEVRRLKALKNEAADFEMACRIRAYAAAKEQLPDLSAEDIEEIEWMKGKADWYDPTVSAVDPFFGRRNHADPTEPELVSGNGYWSKYF